MFAQVPFAQPEFPAQPLPGPFRLVEKRQSVKKTIISNHFADLTRIYREDVNLCLIARPLPADIDVFVAVALNGKASVEISQVIAPADYDFASLWPQAAEIPGYPAWLADVERLAQAFCELFGLREAGLRVRTLDKAMCPRFHVDWLPVRLICSYGGIGTEWLPEHAVDRAKLGRGSGGLPDNESGLIADPAAIRPMPAYAVGLMKGERWAGNEGRGLVHRSPTPTAAQPRRLLLTLDML